MTLDSVVNLKMLGHPVNWFIVWTVLLFAGFAWALAHEYFGPVTAE